MKTMIAAAGVLALTTGAALAQPTMMRDGADMQTEGVTTYQEVYSPSESTNYQFHGGGTSTAPGFYPQNDTQARDWTPNMGAGTTKSSNANAG